MGLFDKALPRFGITESWVNRTTAIPLLLAAYAVHKGYGLEVTEDFRFANLGAFECDPVFAGLAALCGDVAVKEVADFYGRLKEVAPKEYSGEVYPKLLKELAPAGERTREITNSAVLDGLVKVLEALGVDSVYDTNCRYAALGGKLPKSITYEATLTDPVDRAISCVLLEAGSRQDCLIRSDWPSLPWGEVIGEYGAMVCYDYEGLEALERQGLLFSVSGYVNKEDFVLARYVVLVLDPLNGSHGDLLDHDSLCCVSSVRYSSAYILAYDLRESHGEVLYLDADRNWECFVVPYEEISLFNYHFSLPVYQRPSVPDGGSIVRLGDVARLVEPVRPLAGVDKYPTYVLSSSFDKAASPLYRPRIETYAGSLQTSVWTGTNLHIGYDRWNHRLTGCVARSKGAYCCSARFALAVDEDRIRIDYLAYVLLHDPSFAEFFSLELPAELVMHRPIAFIPDLVRQGEIVSEELARLRDVVNSDGVYSILAVGPRGFLTDGQKGRLEGWNILVTDMPDSVYGENGMKALLADPSLRSRTDAVIIDPSTDAKGSRLKGLQRAISLGREFNIPVFIYSSMPLADVEEDLEEDDLRYCGNGRLQSSVGEDALKRLATAIRDELDRNGTLAAKLRSRYHREFDAAEWLEARYGKKFPSELESILTDPNGSFNEMRESAKFLFGKIVSAIAQDSGLEKMDLGSIPAFFRDKVYIDSKMTSKVYRLHGNLMPKTLASALSYFILVTNGGSHTDSDERGNNLNVRSYVEEIRTTNLAMSVLNVYLDLLIWFQSTDGEFDVFCTSRDSAEEIRIECEGTVAKASPSEYYFETEEYGRIHFIPKKGTAPTEGVTAKVMLVTPEKNPSLAGRYEWYASRWEIPEDQSE